MTGIREGFLAFLGLFKFDDIGKIHLSPQGEAGEEGLKKSGLFRIKI